MAETKRTQAPTPDEIASGYEASAQSKISEATVLRQLADTEDKPGRFNFPPDERDAYHAKAERLREEAKVEALLALCARVAEVSR